MAKVRNQRFVDEKIDLTGGDFQCCEFDGCILVMNASPPSIVMHNRMNHCLYEGDGWPKPFLVVHLRD